MDSALLFVVRVWRADGFRASVRRVDDEETRLFKSAGEVASYLDASCAVTVPQPGPAPERDHDGDRK